ncbi:DUF4388 domain-containing protein [Myxococcota bacterium]|jgi:hypothetical protein|nr:DUF4388 domain-containing protein [Myxococcota bacterium]
MALPTPAEAQAKTALLVRPGQRETTPQVYLHAIIEDASTVIDLVNFISETRRTGVLTVVSGPLRKSIYFHQGSVIAAASNQPEDRFGNIVLRLGLVPRDKMEQALREAGPNRRIGNVLISRGLLSPKDLWRVVKSQIEEILFTVLLVNTGELTIAHFDPAQVPNRTALNTQHVLLEGLRRKDEMEHLRGELPPPDRLLVRHRHEAGVTLTDLERRMYDLVDGRRTVSQVCVDSGLGEFESTRILHHLLKVGLVTAASLEASFDLAVTQATVSVSTIVAAYNEAIRLIDAALREVGPGGLTPQGIDTFFDDLDPVLGELFDGVVPAADGRLPPERIFTNLKISQAKEKMRLLRRGLSEYVQFLMFLVRESVGAAEAAGDAHDGPALLERLDRQVRHQLLGFDA